jgi:hypothetical protein
MPVGDVGSCRWCGGRGWKFVRLRRSHETTGPLGERSPESRTRVMCLGCGGSGSAT